MPLLIEIRVRPNASRNKVGGTVGDPPRLVVAVQAPAVDGKANDAVLKELAKAFGLRPRDFTIVFGELAETSVCWLKGIWVNFRSAMRPFVGNPNFFRVAS